jgi:hypothetical protein
MAMTSADIFMLKAKLTVRTQNSLAPEIPCRKKKHTTRSAQEYDRRGCLYVKCKNNREYSDQTYLLGTHETLAVSRLHISIHTTDGTATTEI